MAIKRCTWAGNDPLYHQYHDKEWGAATETLETVWAKLIEGGQIMMPLDTYPFCEKYGWVTSTACHGN